MSREKFEEATYRAYFIKSVVKSEGGRLGLKNDFIDMATLMEKDDRGDYVRDDISAMWFGWNLYRQEMSNG